MKPIEKLILSILKVPENEHEVILEAVGLDYDQPKVSKKGVAAWSLLNVYYETPGLLFAGVFAILFVFPLVIFMNVFA